MLVCYLFGVRERLVRPLECHLGGGLLRPVVDDVGREVECCWEAEWRHGDWRGGGWW